MSSKDLFASASKKVKSIPATNAVNNAGGIAYSLSDKATLAQLAMTGCFNGTFYVSGKDQLKKTIELANKVDVNFLAKLAVYSRKEGLMKDMPAVLTAVLAGRDSDLLAKVFPLAIDNPKMIRNFVQIIRSGATGRKSLGTRPKKLIQNYLDSLTDEQLFNASVGNDPSLQDVIKLVHPKPSNKKRSALFAYLLGRDYNKKDICKLVKDFESFKKDLAGSIPEVPFQMLTALPLDKEHWKQIAENASWTQTRMNLNAFERHGVFEDAKLTNVIAQRLQNQEQIKRTKVFPYQLFTAFQNVSPTVPMNVQLALQKAADLALDNIPEFNGKVYVMVDTSGSMSYPATGNRSSVSTKTRCIDVAALVASAILKKNPNAEIVPFDTKVHAHRLNPLDSIMTNAKTLAAFGGGGTNCSMALQHVNSLNGKGDLVIYVSDNESFMDDQHRKQTATMREWDIFKKRNPNAKLVNIDIVPSSTTQTHDQRDILNIGGFSDAVFDLIAKFVEFGNNKDLWIKTIEEVQI